MAQEKDQLTVNEFIANQASLEEEARELMPWDPKKCTYNMGALRQQVYACRTHNNIGLCYSCSIRCHTRCDIVELFTKRHFTCDCGTERDNRINEPDQIRCEIRGNRADDIPASDNMYGHNFKGLFCDCAKEYDPDSPAVMLQCVMGLECDEDWYHDHCIMGKSDSELSRKDDEKTTGSSATAIEKSIEGFPDLETFDSFLCWKCISKNEYYFNKLLSHELSDELFSCKLNHGTVVEEPSKVQGNGGKRPFSEISEDQSNLPFSLFLKQDYPKTLEKIKDSISDKSDKLYIFLDQIVPFLIKDEPTYEPNEDDDEEVDIFTLTRNIFQNSANRSQIAQNISAFHSLKSKLNDFLKPFAESGEVVKEDDIKTFFQKPK